MGASVKHNFDEFYFSTKRYVYEPQFLKMSRMVSPGAGSCCGRWRGWSSTRCTTCRTANAAWSGRSPSSSCHTRPTWHAAALAHRLPLPAACSRAQAGRSCSSGVAYAGKVFSRAPMWNSAAADKDSRQRCPRGVLSLKRLELPGSLRRQSRCTLGFLTGHE